jgi:hypothetical protein
MRADTAADAISAVDELCLHVKLVVNKPQNLTFPRKIKNR